LESLSGHRFEAINIVVGTSDLPHIMENKTPSASINYCRISALSDQRYQINVSMTLIKKVKTYD